MMEYPVQIWLKRDGSLSVPRGLTFEDLMEFADKIVEFAARAPKRKMGRYYVVLKEM